MVICSFVYASNHARDKCELWKELEAVSTSMAGSSNPWIILGDFNVTLAASEHSRYTEVRGLIKDFQHVVQACGLADLAQVGPLFTWINNQDENPISKKLDRVLVSSCWLSEFPNHLPLSRWVESLTMRGFWRS